MQWRLEIVIGPTKLDMSLDNNLKITITEYVRFFSKYDELKVV